MSDWSSKTTLEQRRQYLKTKKQKRRLAGLCAQCGKDAGGKRLCRGSRRATFRRLRTTLLIIAGGVCACCGEKQREFLTLDHVDSDGAAHRKNRSSSKASYLRDFLKNKIKWQVLCFNCNCAREISGGVCPHVHARGIEG
jgi:hypothetical protein